MTNTAYGNWEAWVSPGGEINPERAAIWQRFQKEIQKQRTRKGRIFLSWQEALDMDSVERILMEYALGWEAFDSWEGYQHKYIAQEYSLGAGIAFTTPTHVAFRAPHRNNTGEWRVFTPDHENLFVFDPLHKLEDALKIRDYLYEQKSPLLLPFASHLSHEAIEPVDGELPWLTWMSITQQAFAPEQICEAAYEAVLTATEATQDEK